MLDKVKRALYLDAARPEGDTGDSGFYRDPRPMRRLAQLLSRDRVFRLVAARIQGLAPGSAEAERELAAYFPLATLDAPDARNWADDQWIDQLEQPADPMGRAARQSARDARLPDQGEAIRRMGDLLLDKILLKGRDIRPYTVSLITYPSPFLAGNPHALYF